MADNYGAGTRSAQSAQPINGQNDAEVSMTESSFTNLTLDGAAMSSSAVTAAVVAAKPSQKPADSQKLGHRRVREGEVTYKKIETSTIMGAIQLGIAYAVGAEASKACRDVLLNDFYTVETIDFPRQGGQYTPAHHYYDFRMKIYATVGFKYFRALFGIRPDDFLVSMCHSALRELSNAGASGSIFYLSHDDEFIVKTVQHKEGVLLQKLLPGYFMNLNQNPRTLLPKFFGLYCYHCNSKNIRLVVMNNLLPTSIKMHQRFDLKGSTYKRKANKQERAKMSPTFKDLDFLELHPEGLMLEAPTYTALMQTIQNDCRVLESFMIMDYSLLIGIHNLDLAAKEKQESHRAACGVGGDNCDAAAAAAAGATVADTVDTVADSGTGGAGSRLARGRSINRHRLVAHSTAMESIQADAEPIDEQQDVPSGGIPARNSKGERLLLFLGVIDILQSYRVQKRLEHTIKAMVHDGNTISVHRPDFYSKRFFDFMGKRVFQKIASPLRHSPSKRRGQARLRTVSECDPRKSEVNDPVAVVGSAVCATGDDPRSQRPHVTSSSAGVSDVAREGAFAAESDGGLDHVTRVTVRHGDGSPGHVTSSLHSHLESVSISDIHLQSGVTAVHQHPHQGPHLHPHMRHVTWTPPMSADGGSTRTCTEGTPSYTESSSSGDIGCPTTPARGCGAVDTTAAASDPGRSRDLTSSLDRRVTALAGPRDVHTSSTSKVAHYRETEMTWSEVGRAGGSVCSGLEVQCSNGRAPSPDHLTDPSCSRDSQHSPVRLHVPLSSPHAH